MTGVRGVETAGPGRDRGIVHDPTPAGLRGEALACWIADDGLWRIESGRVVTVDDYSAMVPLEDELARDAVISVCLRSLRAGGVPMEEAVASLTGQRPGWAGEIALAAYLDAVVEEEGGSRPDGLLFDLPHLFGPTLADGLGRYELIERLGSGSSASVYRAADRRFAEADHRPQVAIKIRRLSRAGDMAPMTLEHEAIRARRIEDRHVVRVLDAGTQREPACTYIVTDYLSGGTLAERMASGAAGGLDDALGMLEGLARGLEAIHRAGLVHCDLKPANVLMRDDGTVAITDFGLALRMSPLPGVDADGTSHWMGTPAYMAPEQYRGEPGAAGATADLYAWGALAWEMLTGSPPNGTTGGEIQRSHASPPSFERRRAALVKQGLERDLAAIIGRCLSPDPADRYQHACDIVKDIERWRGKRPLDWTDPPAHRRVRLWCRRNMLATIVGAAAFLLVVVGGGLLAARLDNRRHERIQSRLQVELASELSHALKVSSGLHENTLPAMWALRTLKDEPIVGPIVASLTSDEMMIDGLRAEVEERRRAGRAGDIQTILMTMQLGVLMADDRRPFADAAAIMSQTLEDLIALLGDDDPVVGDCRAILAASQVKEMWLSRRWMEHRPALSPGEIAVLRSAESALLAADAEGSDAAGAVRRLAKRALRHLYSASLLNDQEKFESYPRPGEAQ